ncbi:hypothetical protein PTTG_28539 [Puccinia triticina 1-1 BBBD Race 1]|uniref:DNA 3'-5' helicase n=1 Tax=Puccinia triticina (isolate 1-1 / race 1 (BBBD)) TaxID=630390 RepID=A0A180GAW6_PUCT1|nr:hypothetical protein PTTG_28539 [Puccinia triticina 1-1 BBBD Race 1]
MNPTNKDDNNLATLKLSQKENSTSKLTLRKEFDNMSDEELTNHISLTVAKFYLEPLKPVQMETVISLVHHKHTFTLAGTGFGKTRIGEVYYCLFPAYKKPIVLVLNPLDLLGDNQVLEKKNVNIKAVNLTRMNFTPDVKKQVLRGDYAFIYLSPEVLLNNAMFQRIFFDRRFLSKLVLTVVDKAHMIYVWGPIAIGKILNSLKILPENMKLVHGELTRLEIHLICVPMKSLLGSCDELKRLFLTRETIPDDQIPPTLIYAPTQNLTWQVL